MKRWHKWFGTCAGLLLLGYFIYFSLQTFKNHDLSALLRPELALAVLTAAFLCALLIPLAGLAWSILLRSMGSNWSPVRLSAIIGFTQMAKYVPGNVAQHIGRTTVALVGGMPPYAYFTSIAAESILLLIASFFVGLLSMSLSSAPMPILGICTDTTVIIAVTLTASAIIASVFFRYAPSLLDRFFSSKKLNQFSIPIPKKIAIVKAFGLYCIAYALLGISLWIIAYCHGGFRNADIFTLTASFALAWLAGYLSPGVPAGLGVREGAMAILLSNTGPGEHVLTIIIAARFATIIADALSFVISVAIIKCNKGEKEIWPQI